MHRRVEYAIGLQFAQWHALPSGLGPLEHGPWVVLDHIQRVGEDEHFGHAGDQLKTHRLFKGEDTRLEFHLVVCRVPVPGELNVLDLLLSCRVYKDEANTNAARAGRSEG